MKSVEVGVEAMDVRAELAAKQESEAERLIEEYRPYLVRCASRYANTASGNHDELYGQAMMAFYEAIKSYDRAKGHFFTFANHVVRLRMIDYVRKLYRNMENTLSLEDEGEDSPQTEAMAKAGMAKYREQLKQSALVAEIEQLKDELREWNITMASLAEQSPRHAKLRETYGRVISMVVKDADILQTICLKRYFPIKKVAELTGVPPKKLERGRTYIIASLIIRIGDYEYLCDYVDESG